MFVAEFEDRISVNFAPRSAVHDSATRWYVCEAGEEMCDFIDIAFYVFVRAVNSAEGAFVADEIVGLVGEPRMRTHIISQRLPARERVLWWHHYRVLECFNTCRVFKIVLDAVDPDLIEKHFDVGKFRESHTACLLRMADAKTEKQFIAPYVLHKLRHLIHYRLYSSPRKGRIQFIHPEYVDARLHVE